MNVEYELVPCIFCAKTGVVELRRQSTGSGYAFGCCCPNSDLPRNARLSKWDGTPEMRLGNDIYTYEHWEAVHKPNPFAVSFIEKSQPKEETIPF